MSRIAFHVLRKKESLRAGRLPAGRRVGAIRKSHPFSPPAPFRFVAAALFVLASLAIGALPASAADLVWVGNDSLNTGNFKNSGNWENNTLPSWGYTNSLKFSQNQNSNVTTLNYDWGEWLQVNDIFWDTSFNVSRTLSASNGGGIGFKTRIENNSSFTQTVAMELSGGQDGASDIQLNPVNGSLIFSGTLWNDFEKDYVVWGSLSSTTTTLTLNTALGTNADPQSAVDFTVSGGRNSNVQVNASQVWAGTTTVNSGAFTTANGVTLASSAIVVAGGTVASTSANTFADTATLTVNSGRFSIGGSDTVASLAGSGGTVDIASGATLTAGNAGSTSYAGSITGSGGFTKVGSGAMTLSGNNSYGGGALVSQGTLVGNASTSFGSGSIVLGDGNSGTSSIVLMANNSGNTTIANNITVANLGTGLVSIGGTNTGASSANAWTGTLTLNRNVQVFGDTTPGSSGRTSFLGQITGSGGITVTQGRVTLQNGTNNFTGPVVVNSGATLQLDVGAGTNEVIPNSAAVTVNGALNFASGGGTETIGSLSGSGTVSSVVAGTYNLAVGGSTNTTFSGGINNGSGVIGLTKSGAGTLLLTGANGFTGGAALNAGALAVGSANALGSSGAISFGGGTLQFSASNTTDYSGRFSNAAGQQYSIDTNGQNVTLGSNLTSSGGSLTKLGAGDVTLSGNNSYGGGTVVSAGRLIGTTASLQGAITNNAAVEFAQATSGTYAGSMTGSGSLTKLGAGDVTLTGNNSYGGGTVVSAGRLIGTTASLQGAITNNAAVTFAQGATGTYAGLMSGSGSVMKTGAGVLEFTAANTYTGPTSVIDGGLRLNGSIAGSLNVALVASLSGTGTVGGDATIIGTHSPGNSPGTQTFNGSLTYEPGAIVNWELIANTTGTAGVNYDQIVLPTGNLTFSGTTTLALSFNGTGSTVDWSDSFWNVNRAWTIYDLSGGTTNSLSNLLLGGSLSDAQGDLLSSTARGYFTTSLSGQDVMLNFVAVPEPATWAMALAGLVCGAGMVHRRRLSRRDCL